MLSVVLFTRRQPAATALVNRIQDVAPIRQVFYESWNATETSSQDGLAFPLRISRSVTRRLHYYEERIWAEIRGLRRLQREALDRVFGDRWKAIDRTPETIELPDKDWKRAVEILERDPPDVMLVFGTSLIPDFVTRIAKVAALNIHTGLSPHYRGANCAEFAILNEDLENIGTTVHLVRKAIDGGEIIHQLRPEIIPDDTEFSLTAKLQRLGQESYVEILKRLEAGEELRPVSQPKDIGLLLMFRALTPGHVRLVRELVEGGAVRRYLERKAQGKTRPKPIIAEIQMAPRSAAQRDG